MTLKEEIGRVAVDILRAALRGGMISATQQPATHKVALLTVKMWDMDCAMDDVRAAQVAAQAIRRAQEVAR